MNKNITFTLVAMLVFSLLVTHNTTKPEKDPPANAPFIIKSNLPGTCRVSTMTASTDTKKNIPVVACKISITTAITFSTKSY
ncbi:hypothetical protein RS429_001227 [Salmonella enterica]|uniref:Uncharacterized protein n=2 Tax=Salmonella enterica I TaxID=59201 RepID=A0A3V8CYZ3_SALET|nr:hypothetical protein [Salmonella enterica subsp. enterica serovar Javiana]EAB4194301.1 hypothetical protein [Salmonella enterica]EBC2490075.1 hypothetical protein [Salmonella enterica subsp. enterica serovar Newport]EBG6949772.1 hypothetical protein [Salmonella enterica subsp. enterica]EBV4610416.1 hypothetical protein [Salmonella enterica subsp. enterica serovar Solt]EBZ9513432.1 hypothetical protein [Salmonella enterica subsp. enterica serovar Eastbourne]EDX8750833.1 hypothetical protein